MLNIKKLLTKILEWINNPTITHSTTGSTGTLYEATSNWTDTSDGTSGITTVGFGVGGGGKNHGVYSNVLNKWLLHGTTSKIYVGDLNLTTAAEARSSIDAQATLSTQAVSVNVTSSTGTYVAAVCRRYGNVVFLTFAFRNTSSIAAGNNVYQGTLASTVPTPVGVVTTATYYGTHALVGMLNTSRMITIRNVSSSAVKYGADDTGYVSFTYICA